MEESELINGIMHLLTYSSYKSPGSDGNGYTLQEVYSFLELNNIKGYDLAHLKNILKNMESRGLVEERHFSSGRIDYSINSKGVELIKNKEKSLAKKWRLIG